MNKRIKIFGLVIVMMLSVTVTVYAAMGYKMTYLPGTTDTVTNLPDEEAATGGEAYAVSSTVPERQGYEFIDWTLDYDVITYRVTYVVNPDPIYENPEDFVLPTDSTKYIPGEMVDVKPQLTTTVDYAFNDAGEKVKGTWKFEVWDKDDFPIYEDTMIVGAWVFTPAPVKTYSYTVEYWFIDGIEPVTKVAKDKIVVIDELGIDVIEDAIPMGSKDLLPKFRSAKKYRIKPNWERVTATIRKDGQVVRIYYEEIPKGQ